MFEALLDLTTASPWAYLAIALVVALDALFPIVPGEASVISAAALAGTGDLNVGLVLAAAALGAAAGDNIAYALGRGLGPRLDRRIAASPRAAAKRHWAERTLATRAAPLILVSRFIPGGRTATTVTAGILRFPWPLFVRLSVAAATLWAAYVTLLGFAGGTTFEDNPLLGVGLGLALGLVAAAVLPLAARVVHRRRTRDHLGGSTDASEAPDDEGDGDDRSTRLPSLNPNPGLGRP